MKQSMIIWQVQTRTMKLRKRKKKVFIETRKPEARPQAAAKSELQLCDLGGT
jgi:hypothetical protein